MKKVFNCSEVHSLKEVTFYKVHILKCSSGSCLGLEKGFFSFMTTVHMITDQGVIGLDGNPKEDAKVWLCFSLLSPGVQNVFPCIIISSKTFSFVFSRVLLTSYCPIINRDLIDNMNCIKAFHRRHIIRRRCGECHRFVTSQVADQD